MGGGRGLAMRQLLLSPKLNGRLEAINVDVKNYNLSGLDVSEINFLEKKFPGITSDSVKPKLILGNAETIQLPSQVNLLTSVEAIQYLDHPIAAMCNWYNQLKDGGLMIVSAEHKWAGWLRYEGSKFMDDPHPMNEVLKIFDQNKIPYAESHEGYIHGRKPDKKDNRDFRNLVIQKVGSTYLMPSSQVKEIWYNPHNYKAVYYQANTPPVEVLRYPNVTRSLGQKYSEQLSDVKRNGLARK